MAVYLAQNQINLKIRMKIACVILNNNIEKQLSIISKNINLIYATEIRIDTFYPKINKAINILHLIKKNFPKIKTILTFRKFEEGGKIKVSEKIREKIIKEIILNQKKYLDFVDIEYDSQIKKNIISIAKKLNKKVILSFHSLKTINDIKIIKKVKNIKNYIKNNNNKFIIKIVFLPKNFKQYFNLLKEINKIIKLHKATVFTIGKTSLISRIIGIILNIPITYVATLKPAIKSQPSLKDLIKAIKKFGYL
ncbi:MAG: type I 3-dehydroquinate dehydratase [Endomicrobia bacterium]|nr:type I 3-dehydroquinate dehydratase [Endomicrobiia bacterium]